MGEPDHLCDGRYNCLQQRSPSMARPPPVARTADSNFHSDFGKNLPSMRRVHQTSTARIRLVINAPWG